MQMLDARQQTEFSAIPSSDSRSNPDNLHASQPYDGSTNGMGFFLGEVFNNLYNRVATIDKIYVHNNHKCLFIDIEGHPSLPS